MNPNESRETTGKEPGGRTLTTADLAAAGRRPPRVLDDEETGQRGDISADDVRTEDEEAVQRLDVRADDEEAGERRDVRADDEEADERRDVRADDERRGARSLEERSAARHSAAERELEGAPRTEKLDPLFTSDLADKYRSRWIGVQSSFVDDPREAVRQGDELVAQVMKTLAESFAAEREKLEGELNQAGDASTENLRLALRRYRSFFERLLTL